MAKVLVQDLAEQLSSAFGYKAADAQLFVRTFFETIVRGLERDKYVRLKGFGTFKMIEVDDRESINVNTGERFMIQGHAKVSFVPDNSLKDLINKPFAHFETVTLSDEVSDEVLSQVDRKFDTEDEVEIEDDAAAVEPIIESEPEATEKIGTANEQTVTDEPIIELKHPVEKTTVTDPTMAETKLPITEQPVIEEVPVLGTESKVEKPVVEEKQPQVEITETKSQTSHVYTVLWLALCLVFLLVGYVCGYFNLFTPKVVKQKVVVRDTIFVPKIVHDTIRIEKDVPVVKIDVKSDGTTMAKPTKNQATETKSKTLTDSAKQVNKGAYEIVGTKETYILKHGETLRIIAERYWGNRNMATYIIIHNQISDPNLVPVGTEIKIPELKYKNK